MKISTLSLSASALLLFIAASLAGVVFWSTDKRQSIEQQTLQLQQIQTQFLVEVKRDLDSYLSSGDAGQLERAKLNLVRVQRVFKRRSMSQKASWREPSISASAGIAQAWQLENGS